MKALLLASPFGYPSPKVSPAYTLTIDRVSRDLNCPESQIAGEPWGTADLIHYRGCGRCAGYQPGDPSTYSDAGSDAGVNR